MEEIKTVSRQLLTQFWVAIIAVLVIVVLYEFEVHESGLLAVVGQAEYWILLVMEPLTLAAIFGALYLFRLRRVSDDIRNRQVPALKQWATIRLFMLQLPLVINCLCYYFFMAPSFGYMAIMLLLAMFFVYPSLSRCESELKDKKTEETMKVEMAEGEDGEE